MRNKVTRRDFMKEAVGMSALAIGILTGGCELFQMTTRKIQSRPVRRDISTLSPNDPIILTYKDAVAKMKALPSSDPRNWTRQAEIHNNHCPHGNWYFLPWHRAYLYYFEEICRELTGNNAFALPYWNWTKNPGIPGVFWGGTSNPLFDTTRLLGPGGSIAPEFVGPSVMEDILSEPNFLIFGSSQTASGRLEATPHNNVHTTILGNMGGFMSPLDPVFWTHHNMVECCWVHWNIVRSHPNTNDPAWTDHAFVGNFVDRHGNPADVRVSDTLLYPLLLYRFEECFAGPPGAEDMRAAERRMELEVFLKRGARVTLDFIEVFEMQGEMDMAIGTSFTRTFPMKRQGSRPCWRQTQSISSFCCSMGSECRKTVKAL